jgi:hypothetical protein
MPGCVGVVVDVMWVVMLPLMDGFPMSAGLLAEGAQALIKPRSPPRQQSRS